MRKKGKGQEIYIWISDILFIFNLFEVFHLPAYVSGVIVLLYSQVNKMVLLSLHNIVLDYILDFTFISLSFKGFFFFFFF